MRSSRTRRLWAALLTLVVVGALTGTARADVLYAADSGDINGSLFTLNPATGAILTSTPLSFGGGNISLTGLAFHPTTGVLYASTANASPTFGFAGHLLTVNPLTGVVTDIGAFGASVSGTLADITFDPTTGILYGWESAGGHQLHTVNITTGLATAVGGATTGAFGGGALAANALGTLFVSPDAATAPPGSLYTVDKVTGVRTLVGPHTGVGGPIGAMDFDSLGILFGIRTQGALAGHLVTIDPTTGAVSDVGASGNSRLDAFAILQEEVAAVPEPASLTLLTLGGFGLVAYSWRGGRGRKRCAE